MLSLFVGTVWAFGTFNFFSLSAVRKSSFFQLQTLFHEKNAQILIKSEGGSNETVARLWLQFLGHVLGFNPAGN